MRLLIPAALVLLSAIPAQAQKTNTYQVSGDGVSGNVTVTPHRFSKGAVKVKLKVTTMKGPAKEKNPKRWVDVWGHRTPDGTVSFRYSYETYKKRGFFKGAAKWLGDPLLKDGSPFEYKTTVHVTARMKPVGKGVLKGDVDGVAQTWTPSGKTDDVMVLVIPGLSTNNWNKFGIRYLDENVAALQARGFEAYRVAIKTEASVKTNADFIAAEIRKNVQFGKRIVIMAHSKGATDATAALALYPDLREHVIGLIGIQPVYGGSPIADIVANNGLLKGAVKVVFEKAFKGEQAAVIDLSHKVRASFVKAHPYPADQIPTIVVQSTFDRGYFSKSVLHANQKLIKLRNKSASDGMVMPQDQLIPGAKRVIVFDDLDHFEPGIRVESPHSPTKVTNAAVDALLPYLTKKKVARAAE